MNPCLLMAAAPMLFAFVACASLTPLAAEDYEGGDAHPAQFANDAAVCTKLSETDQRNLGFGGDIDPTHATYNRMFDACMRASGYRHKPPRP